MEIIIDWIDLIKITDFLDVFYTNIFNNKPLLKIFLLIEWIVLQRAIANECR